jgi:hypothetical protein
MNQRLLLVLPHRQFFFTFPKLLRPYFRHNRRLFSDRIFYAQNWAGKSPESAPTG